MGKSSKPKMEVTKYFMSEHFGVCNGPVDALLGLTIKEKVAWSGEQTAQGAFSIDDQELFGGIKKEGGIQGVVHYLPGLPDQLLSDGLAEKLGRPSGAECPGYRGITSLFFTGGKTSSTFSIGGLFNAVLTKAGGAAGFYWTANSPYLPGVWATVRRAPVGLDPALALIPNSNSLSTELVDVSTWRYLEVEFGDAIDRSAVDFDDSSWEIGEAPFGSVVDANTPLPVFGKAWFRIRVSQPMRLIATVDDNANVYHNGTLIASWGVGDRSVDIPSGGVVAVYVNDTVGGSFEFSPSSDTLALDRFDANPAHIIYECLTNTDWGMGSPAAAIDLVAFGEAAQTLYDERFGLSMIWTRQASIHDFVQEVLDHIQAVLYVDPATGLLTLKLIRGDYDEATLPLLDPDNADLEGFSRKLWGDIVNEIVVTWTNPDNEQDETVTVQDLASIATQGGIVSDGRNYYGVRNAALAQQLAYRDLRSAGQPLASCEAEVDRTQWSLRPASVVKLTWPEYGLSELVMRVTSIDYGRPGDPTIKLSLVEDVYGLDIGTYESPPSTIWEDPSAAPAPLDTVQIFTLPLFFAGDTTVAAFVDSPEYPEVLAGVLATDDSSDTFEYELWDETSLPNGSTEWTSIGTNNIIGYAEIVDALDAEATTAGVTFDNLIGQTVPSVGGFAIIGDASDEANAEIALIDDDSADYTLIRGVLDTVPRAWPAGTAVWFVDGETLFEDPLVRAAGETVDYKLLTRTSQSLLALASAPLESYTLTERPWLPNRPANVVAYGEAWSSETALIDARDRPDPWVTVTWANRNRLLEDSQVLAWTDAAVTPETGQTTRIEVLKVDEAPLTTHDGLTGTTFNVPDASFGAETIVRLRLYADRTDSDGDFASLQYFEHWVQVAPLTADSTYVTADSTTWTADEG